MRLRIRQADICLIAAKYKESIPDYIYGAFLKVEVKCINLELKYIDFDGIVGYNNFIIRRKGKIYMDEITSKVRKVLNQNMWYHGTVFSNWKSFCENGIVADYNKDTSDALDFGYGFYLAPSKERAEHYIISMMKNSEFYPVDDQPMILGFEFTPLEWFESEEYQTKIFGKFDDEFAIFVFGNRTENVMGSKQHSYDVIYGVMSDSVPTIIIQEYKMGMKTKEEVLESLKKSTSMKQISLHNQRLCDIIKLKEAYIIDKETSERKELNINDYCK